MWRSSVSHGLAVRDRRKSQDSGSEPALVFDNGRAKRGKIPAVRKGAGKLHAPFV
jgi:hypothetical protein